MIKGGLSITQKLTDNLSKKVLPLSACFVSIGVLLSYALSRGFLSARGLGFVLILAFGAALLWVTRVAKQTSKTNALTTFPGAPLDEATRKRRLLTIRVGKLAIGVLMLLLIIGLLQEGPLFPRLTGATVSLCIIVAISEMIRRIQRTLS